MAHTLVLWVHVVVGAAGTLLGPLALWTTWRRRELTPAGEAFHWTVLAVCVSAVGLTIFDWSGLWWFVPISAASYAFAFRGYRAARRQVPNWPVRYLRGTGGGYLALLTAILVVSVPELPVVWFVPAVVGTLLIEWVSLRAKSA